MRADVAATRCDEDIAVVFGLRLWFRNCESNEKREGITMTTTPICGMMVSAAGCPS
jgi:hypothetical protein